MCGEAATAAANARMAWEPSGRSVTDDDPEEKEARMRIEQVMRRPVATVTVETSLKEVAAILTSRRISGLPVCDADGRVVGVVSEADILRKEEGVAPAQGSLFDRLIGRSDRYVEKMSARTAGEAMTSPAITIDAGQEVAEAARLMIEMGVNRLPVMKAGELVGIVTRADLVRAFNRSDEEIEREIREDVLMHTLWIAPADLRIEGRRGRGHARGNARHSHRGGGCCCLCSAGARCRRRPRKPGLPGRRPGSPPAGRRVADAGRLTRRHLRALDARTSSRGGTMSSHGLSTEDRRWMGATGPTRVGTLQNAARRWIRRAPGGRGDASGRPRPLRLSRKNARFASSARARYVAIIRTRIARKSSGSGLKPSRWASGE